MKKVDRYITKETLSAFIFSTAVFTFILAGSTILFQLIGDVIKFGIPINNAIQLFVLKTTIIIALSFPMATLLATIFVFGRLNSDSEIIAFRSCGISFIRLVRPVLMIGLIISLLTIWFNETIVPHAERQSENILLAYREKTNPTIKENINITEYENKLPKRIINVAEIDSGLLKTITVAEFTNGTLSQIIRAKTGAWRNEGAWEFYDGVLHDFPIDAPNSSNIIHFKEQKINISVNPFDIEKRSKRNKERTSRELKEHIKNKKASGQDISKDQMDYHMKFALPFASLIFTIIGTSVGLRPQRSTSAQSLGLSLMIILGYYVLMAIGMAFGLSNTLHPIVAAWLPNILIAIVGISYQSYLIHK